MLTDIVEINQNILEEIYNFNIMSKGNVLVFGPAGVGKTVQAIAACDNMGVKYRYLNLSVLEGVDLMGIPKEKDGKTIWAPPEFLPVFDPNEELIEPIVLIVDELDKAKAEVESPMLELFQFRSINGKRFNIQSVIATGNLPDERAKSKIVSHALANRCLIYKVRCEFEPWRIWAVESNINPLVVGFLNKHPEYLLKPNESKDPTAYCKPSPRAWTRAARELDLLQKKQSLYETLSYDDLEATEDSVSRFAQTLVAGRVGREASIKFKVWVEHYRKYEPLVDELIYNGKQPDAKLSADAVLIIAVSALREFKKQAMQPTMSKEDVNKMSENIFGWLMEKHIPPDYALTAGRSVFTENFIRKYKIKEYPMVLPLFRDKVRKALDNT